MDCIFCKIAQGEMPANIIYQNEDIVAFNDIHPQAPHHKVIIPRQHISSLNDLRNEDVILMGKLIESAALLAKDLNIAEDGYRVVLNCNRGGGQTVFHIHAHLLGGRSLTWPPG